MRVGFRALLAFLGILTVTITVALAGYGNARATVTIDSIAVDANSTGNTATFVQTVDDCVSLASVNDTTTIDVVLNQAVDNGLGSFGFNLNYDPDVIQVIQVQDNLLLAAAGPFIPFNPQDTVPDTDGDFRIDVADLSTNYEDGPGVFVRFTVQAVGTGTTALTVSDNNLGTGVPPTVGDRDAVAYTVLPAQGATLAVGQACAGQADLQANTPSVAAPGSATLGAPFDVTVSGTIQNNGAASPVNADTTVLLSTPSDCTVDGGNQRVIQDTPLATGTPLALPDQTFSVTCTSPSFHSFSATVTVAEDDPATTDNSPANNQASSGATTVAVLAIADLSIASIVVSTEQLTPTPMSGTSFDLIGTINVSNAGSDGPTSVSGTATATPPSGCTIWSPQPESFQANVPAGQTIPVAVSFNTRCTTPGDHAFTVAASVSSPDVHVSDTSGNNSGQGSGTFTFKVASCGDDPAPAGSILQNLSPQLLLLIQQLTGTGTPVAEELKMQIDCQFLMNFRDIANTPNDDCAVPLTGEKPCSVSFPASLDLIGGSPPSTPTAQLNPIGIVFVPPELDWANDTEVPNGTVSGSADFGIRTDAGLLPNNIRCTVDAAFDITQAREGGILGNVPESNLDSALADPSVWPNDLNAEKALVESSFAVPIIGGSGVTLWSRSIVPLTAGGLTINMNILTWKVTNPIFQLITGAGWVVVPFPGDALGPDAPGSIGGNPDADDPPPLQFPLNYCIPHNVTLSFNGMAASTVFLACKSTGLAQNPMGWMLWDPDAVNVTGDDGPRSDTSTCSADLDNDGLGANSETYWGTSPTSTDTDSDGILDGPDNCKTLSNPGQADYDGDHIGDPCDPDIDGDGVANASDLCPATAVGAQVGGGGCSAAQVDGDGDGYCNTNAPETGPVPCIPGDNCPETENADQANGDGDEFGDACDGCPAVVQHWTVPPSDSDCDGFTDTSEQFIGTNPNSMCPANANDDVWPVDFNKDRRVNVLDVSAFSSHFGFTTGNPGYGVRYDYNGDSIVNVLDVTRMGQFFAKTCG